MSSWKQQHFRLLVWSRPETLDFNDLSQLQSSGPIWNFRRSDDGFGDGNKNIKQATTSNRFTLFSKITTLHLHHAFLYISLPSLHDYDVKTRIFTFHEGSKQATTKFSFFFLNFNMVLRNHLHKRIPRI